MAGAGVLVAGVFVSNVMGSAFKNEEDAKV
jgi:hypothetical protein